jgi:hypothetical protein
MPHERPPAGFSITLEPDLRAREAACYCVGTMACPPADVREPVVLLTSAVVQQAVERRRLGPEGSLELRVRTGDGCVRVEIRGPRALLAGSAPAGAEDCARLMLAHIADRGAIEAAGDTALVWFEIDSLSAAPVAHEPSLHLRRGPMSGRAWRSRPCAESLDRAASRRRRAALAASRALAPPCSTPGRRRRG